MSFIGFKRPGHVPRLRPGTDLLHCCLQLNVSKTKDMILDFCKNPPVTAQTFVKGTAVETVATAVMDDHLVTPTASQTQTEAVTLSVQTDYDMDDGYFDAILGVVIATVVLVLIGLAVVVIRYMFRHKGSYHTNEAKGMESAETADTALRGDPALQDAMDVSKKEYYI
ncbi:glycophorin-C [Scomber scombrus]|uniref:glycophorin-C n=1 Tax=Scomber scombrus TaxID=13677 RepID=UPI002DDB6903|nr:glycophorin-C [Scomber scombrus]